MWLIDRRFFSHFDWTSFFLMITIMSLGLFFVLSATYRTDQPYSIFFKKQLLGSITGLGIYLACCILDYRTLQRWGYFIFFAIIALLLFTLVKGSIALGGQRWINLGIIKFQPSEPAKLFFPAFFTFYLYTEPRTSTFPAVMAPLLLVLLISSFLIIRQPDLGTGLIVLFSGILLMWLAGIGTKFFAWALLLVALITPLAWQRMHAYQKQRILVFLGEGNNHKERYQIEQSLIAIGSGGFMGKGFLQGTQNTLHFLPESRTDCIFSVICEEWGFLGALIVLCLYLALFLRLFLVTLTIKNVYAQLLAIGVVLHIVLSVIINIAMVTGLLPIVGIPLPLISYGISNLWISCASLGWFNSVACRRFFLSSSRTNDELEYN